MSCKVNMKFFIWSLWKANVKVRGWPTSELGKSPGCADYNCTGKKSLIGQSLLTAGLGVIAWACTFILNHSAWPP